MCCLSPKLEVCAFFLNLRVFLVSLETQGRCPLFAIEIKQSINGKLSLLITRSQEQLVVLCGFHAPKKAKIEIEDDGLASYRELHLLLST